MITILYYLLKVILCSAILYTYYWFVLRNKQFHQYNRFYLIGISVLSWLVPFIEIDIAKEQVTDVPNVLYYANIIAEKNSSIEQNVTIQSSQFSMDTFLILICISVSFLFIVKFLKSLWNIGKLIRQYPLNKMANLYLVMTDVKGTPFSFFKYIFWNTSIDLNSEVGKKILAHEVAHVDENHSIDKLLIELQIVIGWFNPIVWLIRNELYLIHEFIADQKSIQNNDTSVLAELLLASAYPSQQHILSNSFFFSPIKRRIQMFTKTNTKYSYLRRLTILPIMAAMVLLFAFRIDANSSMPILKLNKQYKEAIYTAQGDDHFDKRSANKTAENDLILENIKKDTTVNDKSKRKKLDKVVVVSYKNDNEVAVVGKPVFTTVMIPPIFNDVENGWAKYLERTLDRDLLKRKKAPVGQYTIRVNFEVDQDGDVINVKALNDPGYGTAEEAVRIIESSPKWKPAIQNGSTVKYALNQEVVFMFVDK